MARGERTTSTTSASGASSRRAPKDPRPRLTQLAAELWAAASPTERSAFEMYLGSQYTGAQAVLRGWQWHDIYDFEPELSHEVQAAALVALLQRASLPAPVRVYRVVCHMVLHQLGWDLEALRVGDILRDPGLLSTSLNPQNIKHFGATDKLVSERSGIPNPTMLTVLVLDIELPAGTPGLYVDSISAECGFDFHEEQEILLAPNLELEVLGLQMRKDQGSGHQDNYRRNEMHARVRCL